MVRFSVLFGKCNHTAMFPEPKPEELSVALCKRCSEYRYIIACVKYQTTAKDRNNPTVTVCYGSTRLPEPVKGFVYKQTDLLTIEEVVCSTPQTAATDLDPL